LEEKAEKRKSSYPKKRKGPGNETPQDGSPPHKRKGRPEYSGKTGSEDGRSTTGAEVVPWDGAKRETPKINLTEVAEIKTGSKK